MDSLVRNGGSGWTRLTFNGQTIAWAQSFQDTAPSPVATPQAIQPLDAEFPVEILTPRAVGAGTVRITLFELWNAPVWAQLGASNGTNNGPLAGANDILDLFKAQVKLNAIKITKIITSPSGAKRTINYLGCVITDVDNGETINIGSTIMPKTITLTYLRRIVS